MSTSSPSPASGTVRAAVLDLLRDLRMATVFGNPGSTELGFLADWPEDFDYVLALQEASAAGMADGYARATGRAAFLNLHSAAGVGHALGNLFTAYRNNTPLVVTAGQQARSLLPLGPFLGATDAAQFPRPYVKWSVEPARAADVPAAIAQAHRVATTRPRGPAFVSVPADDWSAPAAPVPPRAVWTDAAPDPAALAALAAALAGARRPVLVVGPEVDEEGAGPGAVALAERLAAPVWASPFAHRLCFPEDHALFAGHLAASPGAVGDALAPHDLVLVLGAPAFTFHVPGECSLFAPGAPPLWQVTADGEAAARAPVGTSVVGSLRLALPALLAALPAEPTRTPPAPRPRPPAPVAADPIPPAYLFERLARALPPGALLAEEAPSHRPAIQAHLPMREWGSFLTMASGGLGYSLPAAVGASLADRARRVCCLVGDGSLMYSVQALWTAARRGLPVATVVANNGGYGAMRAFAAMGQSRRVPGIEIEGLDVVSVARGLGVEARRVERAADLDDALAWALAAPGPTLLDVPVDRAVARLYGGEKG